MNIDELIKEIEIEGEEEIKKLNESYKFEIDKLKKEFEDKLKRVKDEWDNLIEREKITLKEKKELDLKNKIELLILDWKNQILENFKSYSDKLLNELPIEKLKEFYKKEIIKNIESKDSEIHFDRNLKKIFDENFKKEILSDIKIKFPDANIKFVEDSDTFVKGKSFISKISPKDKFIETLNENILEISKIIFEEKWN